MSYMLPIQDGQLMPNCLCVPRFFIHEGQVKVYRIRSNVIVIGHGDGSVINGRFNGKWSRSYAYDSMVTYSVRCCSDNRRLY